MTGNDIIISKLDQLIDIFSRMAPPVLHSVPVEKADCFVWNPQRLSADPVEKASRIDIRLIATVENIRNILVENTRRFSRGFPANNVLLWGARGMGKSSLVKATHALINTEQEDIKPLKLIEIHREDINTLPLLMNVLKKSQYRFILFCDDLSFDHEDTSYKSLKTILDGGIEGRPGNIILYATSNRRHLVPRDMMENDQSTAINPSDVIEEKMSLSDRFGLWLGFHSCSQDDYIRIVRNYAEYYGLQEKPEKLIRDALEWSTTRGGR